MPIGKTGTRAGVWLVWANYSGMNRADQQIDRGVATGGSFCSRVDSDLLRSQLTAFFGSIHAEREGSLRITSGFLVGKKLHGITKRRFAWPAELQEAITWIGHEALIGRDVYHSGIVHLGGRRSAHKHVSALVAEVDHRRLPALPEPTLVVQSSPTLRQVYWSMSELVPVEHAQKLLARVGAEVDQLLLLPGTPNNRFSGGPKIEVVSCSEIVYSAEGFAATLPDLSADPLAKGWHPSPQLRPAERLGQAAVAVATVAGSSTIKVGVAAVTAAIAVTGFTGGGKVVEEIPSASRPPEPRVTEQAQVDVPRTSAEVVEVLAVSGAPPVPRTIETSEGGAGSRELTRPDVRDVVVGSPGAADVDTDPGALSGLTTAPANEAKMLTAKVTETELGTMP